MIAEGEECSDCVHAVRRVPVCNWKPSDTWSSSPNERHAVVRRDRYSYVGREVFLCVAWALHSPPVPGACVAVILQPSRRAHPGSVQGVPVGDLLVLVKMQLPSRPASLSTRYRCERQRAAALRSSRASGCLVPVRSVIGLPACACTCTPCRLRTPDCNPLQTPLLNAIPFSSTCDSVPALRLPA